MKQNAFRFFNLKPLHLLALALLALPCSGPAKAQEQGGTGCQASYHTLKKARIHYEKALSAFENGLTNQAWKSIRIAESIEPCFAELHMLKAAVYEDGKEIDSAIASYLRAFRIDPDVFPNGYFFLALLEKSTGKYREADAHFAKFLSYPQTSPKLQERAKMEQMRNQETLKLVRETVPFSPKNLGPKVNSPFDEYLPLVTVDDSMLVFTRRYQKDEPAPHLEEDFFFSLRDSTGNWTPATLLPGPVNSPENEGAQFISPDGRYLFFAGCNRPDGFGSCDIYVSRRTEDGWGKPFNIGPPVNTHHWESQPCMSSDGKTLYFTSNRPGGFGKSDIWKAELSPEGIWREPVNLGPSINTAGDENSPFLHPDGKTLYFSSNGHGGMGGLDLFVSRMDEKGDWSAPRNLGYPINTYADEATLSVNAKGDTAYFSSDHLQGYGKKDLYSFALYEQVRPAPVSFMKGTVLDIDTGKPLPAKFELISLETGLVRIQSQAGRSDGQFLICLPCDEEFALNVSFPGHLFYSEHIALDARHMETPMRKTIRLEPIRKGASIVLKNIFYPTGAYSLEETSLSELERVFRFLMQNPEVRIEIGGHTDNVGSEAFNKDLSLKRAQAVAGYLIGRGIPPGRVQAAGYGFDQPAASNQTEEGRALNRRTEMKIL